MIEAGGYPVETHYVTTADAYILTMYRIPAPGKKVAFLQHGLLCSSADWVVMGPGMLLDFL
jgi:lysosomal acid lipase/cholesteryl ester hydrolase